MEERKSSLKRIFINNIDSYSSKYIAKFLSECVVGAHSEDEEEEESVDTNINKEKAFEIVGTVSEESQENRDYVLEQYYQLKREELLPKLMDCNVIVYNITQHQDQLDEAFWAVATLHNELDNFTGPKMFILVSTVMTWACRKPIDPEDEEKPFTDEDFRRRRPHANFRAHNDLEKRVVQLGKTNKHMFSTYVVVSGMQYGMGEQIFHYFFKTSWEGLKAEVPVFGDGTNIVPTIHINDLASVIQNVIEHRPSPYYLLAVDYSSHTMEEIVQAISNALGPGSIKKIPLEEAYLIREITVMEIDYMTVNLRMESAHLKELLSISWQCEKGLVENIGQVVQEYRQYRGLQPIRICVMGPPAVGKSTLSKIICDHYKLHHVKLKPTITQTLDKLKETVNKDPSVETNSTADAQELLNSLTESMEQNEGFLEEHLLLKVMRDKLMTKPCQNQGFVLDGFPKTYDQVKELYENDEEEEEETVSNKILPEFVFVLDASDLFLKERVINLPETEVEKNSYEPELFLKRLSRYRHRNSEDSTVSDFYDEFNITTLNLEITSKDEPSCLHLLEKIIETVGPSRNYSPTIEEMEEEERKKMEEKQKSEAQRKEEEEKREAEEARERAARWEEWSRSVEQLHREEEDLLEAETAQMRSYLMEHVMPTLSQGLLACCSAQPQDPVDFLAEYLMNNNPLNSCINTKLYSSQNILSTVNRIFT
ncbi:adenylate kinase 7 [Boleophthalmus pectinirostris]|uniref:adenylate kinase 7 n=1 Tax=Boleophthalmus pectinirostris TaxID=150288 RepID=UPI00242B5122|nr:adenylate kinase 7 [Boleophthalmus pectinirostris]